GIQGGAAAPPPVRPGLTQSHRRGQAPVRARQAGATGGSRKPRQARAEAGASRGKLYPHRGTCPPCAAGVAWPTPAVRPTRLGPTQRTRHPRTCQPAAHPRGTAPHSRPAPTTCQPAAHPRGTAPHSRPPATTRQPAAHLRATPLTPAQPPPPPPQPPSAPTAATNAPPSEVVSTRDAPGFRFPSDTAPT